MDAASVQAVYSRWARVYDWVFGLLFGNARRLAFQRMELKRGNYAIEVGVGTGLSLASLPEGCHLVGVDFSRPMLERALMRWRADSVNRTAVLVEGDGAYLPFPDKTFDAAFAAFVVSAAPDAVALLGDMQPVSYTH